MLSSEGLWGVFIRKGGVGATLPPRHRSAWPPSCTIGSNRHITTLEWMLEMITTCSSCRKAVEAKPTWIGQWEGSADPPNAMWAWGLTTRVMLMSVGWSWASKLPRGGSADPLNGRWDLGECPHMSRSHVQVLVIFRSRRFLRCGPMDPCDFIFYHWEETHLWSKGETCLVLCWEDPGCLAVAEMASWVGRPTHLWWNQRSIFCR